MKKKSVILAISGGVDSSVALYLLKKKGYLIKAIFMKNWEEDQDCSVDNDLFYARSVCFKLSIPLIEVNFSREYKEKVFNIFLKELLKGKTPNPDILCNKEIKFKILIDYIQKKLGYSKIATGHYAKINEKNQLIKALDKKKDQTYFLYAINKKRIPNILFPLGNFLKSDVRKLAKRLGFLNYNRKDSTGICFIGKRNFKNFLCEYLKPRPGKIKTLEGKIIGKHEGLMFYTIGQRKGLKIGGKKKFLEKPWYIFSKDIKNNILFVVQDKQNKNLYKKKLICNNINWLINIKEINKKLICKAKIRYQSKEKKCSIKFINKNKIEVLFIKPQFSITPGQSIVFYKKNICLGGGIIN